MCTCFPSIWADCVMSHQLCSFNSLLYKKSSMFRPKATLNIKLVRPQKASSYLWDFKVTVFSWTSKPWLSYIHSHAQDKKSTVALIEEKLQKLNTIKTVPLLGSYFPFLANYSHMSREHACGYKYYHPFL